MTERQAARAICKRFCSNDPFEIAGQLGYLILYTPLKEIRGFHQKLKRCHIIYLDNSLGEHEAAFVCAHELGHALLHGKTNRLFLDSSTYFVSQKYENEADRFAVQLLHPDEEVENLIKLYQYTVPQIARMWGVPEELAQYRVESCPLKSV